MLFVEVNQHLAVAASAELMVSGEGSPQLLVVVNLTVGNDYAGFVLIEQRLMTTGRVNDG